jgi:hypothetical protein
MFTGVVVQSFSYVYQVPGSATLDREQMREYLLQECADSRIV